MKVLSVLSLAVIVFFAVTLNAQQIVLESTGMTDGEPEAVLPLGALVHIRLANPMQLIQTLEMIAVPFVPQKALPPQLQPAFQTPNPILTLIGAQMTGRPLDADGISQITGLDPKRSITMTVYPAEKGVVLSLPMANGATLAGLLTAVSRAVKFERVEKFGVQMYVVQAANPDLPDTLHIVCSKDRAYICLSSNIASNVSTKAGGALKDDALIGAAMAAEPNADLLAVVGPGQMKAMLPMLAMQFKDAPVGLIAKLRREYDNNTNDLEKSNFNMQIRANIGIRDVPQGFDILEALSVAGYRVLSKELLAQLMAFDGIAFGVDLDASVQTVTFSAYSKNIKPEASTQPLPMDAVRKALTVLPGDRSLFTVSGKAAPDSKNAAFDEFLNELLGELTKRNLPTDKLQTLIQYRGALQIAASLESSAPWVVTTTAYAGDAKPVAQYATAADYLTDALNRSMFQSSIQMLPKQDDGFIESIFRQRVTANNANAELTTRLMSALFNQPNNPWVRSTQRVLPVQDNGGVKTLTYEDVYTSASGFFGHSQYEFIAREIYEYKTAGDYLIVKKRANINEPTLNAINVTSRPLPKAMEDLLARAPKNVTYVNTARALPYIRDGLVLLTDVENLTHQDIDAYLKSCDAALAAAGDINAGIRAVEAIPAPLAITSTHIDPVAKKTSVVLFFALKYPRPKVMPVVRALTADFEKSIDAVGGGAVFTSVTPGRYECRYVQRTDGLALFVRSVADTFFTTYMSQPNGIPTLMQSVMVPGDGEQTMTDTTTAVNNKGWHPNGGYCSINPKWIVVHAAIMSAAQKQAAQEARMLEFQNRNFNNENWDDDVEEDNVEEDDVEEDW